DSNALGAQRHGHFDRLLHGTPECNPALELKRDILGHQSSLDLGLLYLLDIEENLLARKLGELVLDLLDLLPLATDDDAGTRGIDLDADAVRRAFDEDARDGSLLQLLHQLGTD